MKIRTLLIAGMVSVALCGCGDDPKTIGNDNQAALETVTQKEEGNTTENTANDTFSPSGYYLSVDGFKLSVDDKMDNVLANMGQAESCFEAPSCAFDGIERTYTYKSGEIEVKTYIGADKADYVNYVILKNDLISTDEGLAIGDDVSKVTAVYGDNYKDNNGSFEYAKGNMKLLIVIEEGKVVSIQYVSTAVNN